MRVLVCARVCCEEVHYLILESDPTHAYARVSDLYCNLQSSVTLVKLRLVDKRGVPWDKLRPSVV